MANLVIMKGRLVKDVELKTTTSGMNVASFSIAVNRDYVKEGEERQADFFNCTAWGKLGEFASKYFSKGQEMLLTGRLQNRSWDAEDGTKRYVTDIVVNKIEFCGSKSQNNVSDTAEKMVNDFNNAMANGTLDVQKDELPF